jgi:predicted phosphate transport protein (TIGR00153 family)
MGFKIPRLVPREEKFFDMFDALAALGVRAAEEFTALVKNPADAAGAARRLKTIENEGDELTRDLIGKLNRSFVTPIDRGDIHALACGLDEIIDYIEVVGHKISLYEFDGMRPEVTQVAELTLAAAKEVEQAVHALRKFPDAETHLRAINRLEAEADHICRGALANLFNNEKDVIAIIKWKEIFEVMEGTTDRCEDVADIVDGVIVKNA